MSAIIKQNPQGIDNYIQAFQVFLYGQLKSKWGLEDSYYAAYGRSYRNQQDGGYVPEVLAETNGDYRENFFDDSLYALSFFGVQDDQKYLAGGTTANVYLIFMVKTDKIKDPAKIVHRADEEIRLDVERVCKMRRFGFVVKSIETGIDTVFREYSGWRKTDGIKFRDMNNSHCFRINFSLLYSIQNC